MSSGEGADETSKDAADIAAFFKNGKPKKESAQSNRSERELLPSGDCCCSSEENGVWGLRGNGSVWPL